MKVGILGSGFMGSTHARAFAKLPGVKVVGVSSRTMERASKLAAEVDAMPTTDDMTLINDPTIDAISNTLPTHLHRKYTIAALNAGKHVLLEKPFGLTLADCDEMIMAWKKSGKHLMIAQVLRFNPEYTALVEFVQSGKLGKPLSATASRLSVPPNPAWFHKPKQSGGAVLDLMIHDLDALNWLLGTPKSIYARGQARKSRAWDHIYTILDYGASHAFIEATQFMPAGYPFTMTLKALCERGSIEYIYRAGGVSVEMGGGETQLMVYEPGTAYALETNSGDMYENEIAYFVKCVKQNRAPELGTPEQARLAVQLSLAARKSLETGKVIPIQTRRKSVKRKT
jgi:predicted dehydrogenase